MPEESKVITGSNEHHALIEERLKRLEKYAEQVHAKLFAIPVPESALAIPPPNTAP